MDCDSDSNVHSENSDHDESEATLTNASKQIINVTKAKSCKRGIVYIGFIPEGMSVRNVRLLLSKYGEIERIFLDKDKTLSKGNKKSLKRAKYVEGWVEFKKKSVAKMVASSLNGTIIGGKRRTTFYGALWNLKYLKRFKWSHLAEQMTYEKQLRDQQLRLEINRAKREATFYTQMIERSRHKKRIFNDPNRNYKQRVTDEQITLEKQSDQLDDDLLANIFK